MSEKKSHSLATMRIWIALLRGINVGGRNKLPMKTLAEELEKLGLSKIKTYIQSGNVIFRASEEKAETAAADIGALIKAKWGFEPQVTIISDKELAAAALANPFSEAGNDENGKSLHFFFLAKAPPIVDRERLNLIRQKTERWLIDGNVFYLHTPDGVGDSKLAAQVEKILGVGATARNWRTVNALLELAKD